MLLNVEKMENRTLKETMGTVILVTKRWIYFHSSFDKAPYMFVKDVYQI